MRKYLLLSALVLISSTSIFAQAAQDGGSIFNRSTLIGAVIGAIVGGLAGFYWEKRKAK